MSVSPNAARVTRFLFSLWHRILGGPPRGLFGSDKLLVAMDLWLSLREFTSSSTSRYNLHWRYVYM